MDDRTAKIADNCLRLSLNHASWQGLGFKRRPRRGLMHQLITPHWKRSLERKTVRELLVIFTAAHVVAVDPEADLLLRDVVDFYWGDGVHSATGLGFPSKEACLLAIQTYTTTPSSDWHKLLIEHIDVFGLPDKKQKMLLLARCVQFTMSVQTMMLYLRLDLDMTHWPKLMSTEPADIINEVFGEDK